MHAQGSRQALDPGSGLARHDPCAEIARPLDQRTTEGRSSNPETADLGQPGLGGGPILVDIREGVQGCARGAIEKRQNAESVERSHARRQYALSAGFVARQIAALEE